MVGVVLFKIKDWFKSINFNIIFISETINEVRRKVLLIILHNFTTYNLYHEEYPTNDDSAVKVGRGE